jgi:hypothetical protein
MYSGGWRSQNLIPTLAPLASLGPAFGAPWAGPFVAPLAHVQHSLYSQVHHQLNILGLSPGARANDVTIPVEPPITTPIEPPVVTPVEPPIEPPIEPPLPPSPGPNLCATSELDDATCGQILNVFQTLDPKAAIMPGIGLPSQNNGVCTITHVMPGMPDLKINGLTSKSPLANNALFSAECADGKILNLYEMMLPDVASPTPGGLSSVEAYTRDLSAAGLNVAGTHFHWWGASPYVAAVHHQSASVDPVTFAERTVQALQNFNANMNM